MLVWVSPQPMSSPHPSEGQLLGRFLNGGFRAASGERCRPICRAATATLDQSTNPLRGRVAWGDIA